MSELTRTTIIKSKEGIISMKLYQIHPDATMDYFEDEDNKDFLGETSLYFLMDLLERTGNRSKAIYKMIQKEISKIAKEIGEDEFKDDDTILEATFLIEVAMDIIEEVTITSNLNDNWETGRFDELTSKELISEHLDELSSVTIDIKFKNNINVGNLEWLSADTTLDTALIAWL